MPVNFCKTAKSETVCRNKPRSKSSSILHYLFGLFVSQTSSSLDAHAIAGSLWHQTQSNIIIIRNNVVLPKQIRCLSTNISSFFLLHFITDSLHHTTKCITNLGKVDLSGILPGRVLPSPSPPLSLSPAPFHRALKMKHISQY